MKSNLPFSDINNFLLSNASNLVQQWAPGGKFTGSEYVACNPTRNDKRAGSFKINTRTGKWADFATGDKGGDLISLYAYLNSISQSEAARELSLSRGIYREEKKPETKTRKETQKADTQQKPFELHSVPLNDGDIARAVLRTFPETIKFDFIQKKFLIWNGKIFETDQAKIYQLIKSLIPYVKSLIKEARESETKDCLEKLLKKLNTSASIEAIKKYIETEPEVSDKETNFNQQNYKAPCLNGTIDLRNCKLLQHNKGDKFSYMLPVPYIEDAVCPKFENFISETMSGDEELVRFIQRYLGYCLTGDVSERIMVIWVGRTTNGKGVLFRILEHIFGDFVLKAASDLILQKDGNHIPNDLAATVGKRLVLLSESEARHRLAESLLKDLVGGGDSIQARFLFKEFFTFVPKFKLIFATNFPPRVTAGDAALWRRIRVVKFDYEVPPEKVNPRLTEELKAEAPGILSWIVKGCLDWQKQGLNCPESVMLATNEYKAEMDTVGHWIEENCILSALYETANDTLYKDYEVWAKRNGHRPMSKNSLGRELTQKGFKQGKTGGARTRKGIAIKDESGF